MKQHFFSYIAWTVPFFCFLAGYLIFSFFYTTEQCIVPNVVGKNVQDALHILSTNSLNARLLMRKEDSLLPEGTVLSQTPADTQKVKRNQTIFLVISSKPTVINTPSLIGKNLEEITTHCASSGIKPKIYFLPSNHPANICFAQSPSMLQPLETDTVTAYVAQDIHKPVIMPQLKGKPISEIIDFLDNYAIKPEIMHTTWQSETHQCTRCVVVDQRPLPGTLITLLQEKPYPVQIMVE
jgi:beta-lactam-binding protein with PASTA domain